MALSSILRLHRGTSLVKFWFLQAEASCSHQDTICFDIIKEKRDFTFSPSATCLLNVFWGANAGWSILGRRWSRKVGGVVILSSHVVVVVTMILHWILNGVEGGEGASKRCKWDNVAKVLYYPWGKSMGQQASKSKWSATRDEQYRTIVNDASWWEFKIQQQWQWQTQQIQTCCFGNQKFPAQLNRL